MTSVGPVSSNAYVPAQYDTALVSSTFDPALPGGSDGPALNQSWLDAGFIPQGQGYDGSGELLTTYNDGESVRLALQDTADGSSLGDVELRGEPYPPGPLSGTEAQAFRNAHPHPDKGGGVSMDEQHIYVADTEGVYVYDRQEVENAAKNARSDGPLPAVDAKDFIEMPKGADGERAFDASYITVKDGYAYVGQFGVRPGGIGDSKFGNEPGLMRYRIEDGKFTDPTGPIDTPYYAQGVAVTEKGLIYTTSYSNDKDDSPKSLQFQPFSDFEAFEVPENYAAALITGNTAMSYEIGGLEYYAEELNIVGDELWITYESAAKEYEDDAGQDHIVRIPLSDLDLGNGVSPADLAER